MSKVRLVFVLAVATAFAALLAGCGGGTTSSTSTTPSTGTTVSTATTETTAATGTTAGTTTTTETTTTTATTGGGDVAAGKTTFESACQACHQNDGQTAGVGPVLAGGGRSEDRIRSQVVNGGGGMPAGLVSGTDLDNVVAFVLSIQ